MGKLRTIYLALLNKRDKIVKKDEIIRVIENYSRELSQLSVKNALWYLSRRNYIKRIFLDYYYVNSIEEKERKFCNYQDRDLLFEVLNKEKIRWYVGLDSALHLYGEAWQVPNVLTIINDRVSGERTILRTKVKFIKIRNGLIFGIIKDKTKNRISYSYSDPQKTKLDLVYLRRINKPASDNKTRRYLKNYPRWMQKLI